MPNEALTGVFEKIERADHHLSDLNAAVQSWGAPKQEDHTTSLYYHPQRQRMEIRLENVKARNIAWALILGDIVHNLRSALDHLVYQLALLKGSGRKCCNKTCFPIFIDHDKFLADCGRIKQCVSPEAFAAIERLQPYNTAKIHQIEPTSIYLWIIHQLDIIDKHRMIIVADKYFRASNVRLVIGTEPPVEAPADDAWQPMKDGAVIGGFDIPALILNEKSEMNVQAQMEVKIFFNETGYACDGLPVETVLKPCVSHITEI